MSHSIRWWLPLSMALLLPACNDAGSDAAAPGATVTPVAEPAAAEPAAQAPAVSDASRDDDFELTMDEVDAYYATIGKISQAAQRDPDLEDIAAQNADESDEEFAARIEADPTARALITSAGMSAVEFARVNGALFAGMMTVAAIDSGALKEIPDGIDPQYVEFAREHKAELEAKMAALQASVGG